MSDTPKYSKDNPTIATGMGGTPLPSVPGSLPAVSAPYSSIPGSQPALSGAPYSGAWENPATSSLDPATTSNDPNIGQVFGGKYLIERHLGEGGMGVVYLARHKAIGKRVAIKVLHGDAVKDPEVVERFKVEAQAASSIGSEHIIDITDFSEAADGQTYFVMEFLDGRPLSKLIEELKRVPPNRIARISKQIALGLGAAHQAGIVHRDLKPDNIFLVKRSGGEVDFVKILDFGIAKVGQSANKLTKAGAIFGTPHYMSPEQASGSPVDHRTDIYALGVILYEASVGRVPFDADNFMGILTQHMYKAPVPPRAVPECPPDLPPGLEVIIMRCLRKKPEERYSTMEELAEDLDRLMRGEVPKAAHEMMALSAGYQSIAASALQAHGMPHPIPGEPPGGVKKSRMPLIAAAAAVLVVVGIAVAALVGPSKGDAKQKDPEPAATASDNASATATASTTAKPAPTPTPTTVKKSRMILVSSNATSARVYEGDKELGEVPLNVELEEGTKKTITLRATGYAEKQFTLDAKTAAKFTATLKGFGGGGGGTVKKAGGGEADDPWAKKN